MASLPISIIDHKLVVPITVNGSPEQIAVDTGAGISVISSELAGRLDIPHDFDHAADVRGVGGASSVIFIGQIDKISLGNISFAHLNLPIVNFHLDGSSQPVSGLLGGDILHNFDVDLNIPEGRMNLWAPKSCTDGAPQWADAADATDVTIDESHHILAPFGVNGVTLNAVLDTGAGWTMLTRRAAFRAGMTEDDEARDPEITGTGVNDRGWTGHLHRFHAVSLGSLKATDMPAGIVPSEHVNDYDALIGADGLIGFNLLSSAHLWISYRTHTLYVERATRG